MLVAGKEGKEICLFHLQHAVVLRRVANVYTRVLLEDSLACRAFVAGLLNQYSFENVSESNIFHIYFFYSVLFSHFTASVNIHTYFSYSVAYIL